MRTTDNNRMAEVLTAAGIEFTKEMDEENRPTLHIPEQDPAHIGHIAFVNKIELQLLGERHASLEEAFMEITGHAVQYQAKEGN